MTQISSTNEEILELGGFFNGIPADSALIDHQGVSNGFDLVSTSWVEWKCFTLHQAPKSRTPRIHLSSGEIVHCHGYILGTWTDSELHAMRKCMMMFVVDAEFINSQYRKPCNFLFGSKAWKDSKTRAR
jgi:hypothetical protein